MEKDIRKKMIDLGYSEEQIEDFGAFSLQLIDYFVQGLIDSSFTDKELSDIEHYANSNDWLEEEEFVYIAEEYERKKNKKIEEEIDELLFFIVDLAEKNRKMVEGIINKVNELDEAERDKAFDEYLTTYEEMKLEQLKNIKVEDK